MKEKDVLRRLEQKAYQPELFKVGQERTGAANETAELDMLQRPKIAAQVAVVAK